MASMPFVAGRSTWEDAARLMSRFGMGAESEAAARAESSRDKGNLQGFCHWRQIERLILHLSGDGATETLH